MEEFSKSTALFFSDGDVFIGKNRVRVMTIIDLILSIQAKMLFEFAATLDGAPPLAGAVSDRWP
jgi:hypothetical protein